MCTCPGHPIFVTKPAPATWKSVVQASARLTTTATYGFGEVVEEDEFDAVQRLGAVPER